VTAERYICTPPNSAVNIAACLTALQTKARTRPRSRDPGFRGANRARRQSCDISAAVTEISYGQDVYRRGLQCIEASEPTLNRVRLVGAAEPETGDPDGAPLQAFGVVA